MWVLTEDESAALNLEHVFLIYVKSADVGHGVMAIRDRGDMGTLLKVCDSAEEARRWMHRLLGLVSVEEGDD